MLDSSNQDKKPDLNLFDFSNMPLLEGWVLVTPRCSILSSGDRNLVTCNQLPLMECFQHLRGAFWSWLDGRCRSSQCRGTDVDVGLNILRRWPHMIDHWYLFLSFLSFLSFSLSLFLGFEATRLSPLATAGEKAEIRKPIAGASELD